MTFVTYSDIGTEYKQVSSSSSRASQNVDDLLEMLNAECVECGHLRKRHADGCSRIAPRYRTTG